MAQLLRKIAESKQFQNFITVVILLAGVLVGIETYPRVLELHGDLLHLFDKIILGIFVVEVLVKMGAEGKRPWRYFYDGWNVFDFLIVAAAFMPIHAEYVTVLRLMRLLRVLKLVRALPKLQLLVSALLKSIPSMGYVSLLLLLLFYVYGVAAVFMWGHNDPVHFGNLQVSMVSLFRAVTLEDWTDLMYIQMYGCDHYGYDSNPQLCTQPAAHPVGGAAFFISFVLLGTMIILNLFIGVIMNGMDEAQQDADDMEELERLRRSGGVASQPSMADELAELQKQLTQTQAHIAKLSRRAKREAADSEPVAAADPSPRPAPAE